MCTPNINAQIVTEVVVVDLDSTVTVPAGNATIVIFVSGSSAEFDGDDPPNGDLFIVGGNPTGPAGFLASAGCDLPDLTAPMALGDFPDANFLIAGGDAAGVPLLSNHTDTTTVDPASPLSCGITDVDGDPATADGQTADNAWAQTFSVASPTDIDSVIFGLVIGVEGNNPFS